MQVAQSVWQLVQVVSEALNWLLEQVVQAWGVGLFGFTFPATQVLHWEAPAAAQVAQSVWQFVQVFTSALYWLEAQLVQDPFVGWAVFTLSAAEQVRQSLAVAPPEQVAQSP